MTFDEFSEVVERMCCCGWRSVFGKNNQDVIDRVNSIMVTRKNHGNEWEFSFCLRIGKAWHQAVERIEPVRHDVMDIEFEAPTKAASDLAFRLMGRISEDVRLTAAMFGGDDD